MANPPQISFSNITNPILGGLKTVGKGLLNTLNPKIPTDNTGKPTNAIGDLSKIAGAKPINQPVTTVKPKSPVNNLPGPSKTLPAQFQQKTTGTQTGDLAKGLISSAPLQGSQSSTQGGTNSTVGPSPSPTLSEPQNNTPQGFNYDPTNSKPYTQQLQDFQTVKNPDNSYEGLISKLATRGTQDSPEVQKAREALTASQLAESKALAFNSKPANGGGVSKDTGEGNDALQRALYGNEQNALSSQLSSAVTTQGQQIGATQGAAGLVQPVGQFGVLTNPITGQPVNGLSATQAAQQGGYIQGLQSGAQAQGAVSGTTNAANAALSGAQAFGVNLALKQMGSLGPIIKNFLSQTGINPSDAQIYNQPINTYLGSIQASGQITQWNTLMSELNRYSSQLIGTGSLTPTGITAATQLQDPSNLSLAQIDGVLQTLSDVGNNQVYNLQQQTNSAAPGNSIYTGSPVSPVTSTRPSPVAGTGTPGAGITNPVGQAAAGIGVGAVPGLVSSATQGGVFAIGAKLLKLFGL